MLRIPLIATALIVAVLTPGPGRVRAIVDVPFAREERTWARLNADARFAPLRDRLLDLVRAPAAAPVAAA